MNYYNPYLVIPFVAWFSAQAVKFLAKAIGGELNFRYFYSSGDMPSAHSAAVCALAVTALVIDGFTSPIFGISALFAAVVIYDSFGVRRASGDQSVVINAILRNLSAREKELSAMRLREELGHQPIEVIAGGAIGVAVALGLTASHWAGQVGWLVEPATDMERWLYLGVFSLLLLAGLAAAVIVPRLYQRRAPSIKQFRRVFSWSVGLAGAVGLLVSLLQFQAVPRGEWRLWALLLLALVAVSQIILFEGVYRGLSQRYRAEAARLAEIRRSKRHKRR